MSATEGADAFDLPTSSVAGEELRAFIERAENMNDEVARIGEDKKELFKEIKGRGFCAKTVKDIIKYRAEDPDKRAEAEAVFDLYLTAIGGR